MSSHAQRKFADQPADLPEKESGDLEQLHQALTKEHEPQTPTERFLVDRMVSALWFANRAKSLLGEAEYGTEKERANAIRILTAYRISNEQSFDRAVQTLQQLRADRDDQSSSPAHLI